MIIKIVSFLKELLISPSLLFKKINEGMYKREIVLFFIVGFLITFVKSFYQERTYIDLFSELLNKFLSFLGIPLVSLILIYMCHFLYIFILYKLCKRISKKNIDYKVLFYQILSLSSIGVIFQLLFLLASTVISYDLQRIIAMGLMLWVIFLTLKAIHIEFGLPYSKAFLCFIISSIVFICIVGPPAIMPSFAGIISAAK